MSLNERFNEPLKEPRAIIKKNSLKHNIACLREHLQPQTKLFVAIKADGYGHGAVQMAKWLELCNIDWFGVATMSEALELRQASITKPILVLSPVYAAPDFLAELLALDVDLTLIDENSMTAVVAAAQKLGKKARVQLKVDTGMGRLGQSVHEGLELAIAIEHNPHLTFAGVWTHFACADVLEKDDVTKQQLARFHDFLQLLAEHSIDVPLIHAANSAGMLAFPESHFDMVRLGGAAYGYLGSDFLQRLEPRLRPIMTVQAPITFVKAIKKGTCLSYGHTWQAPQDTRIATVRYGYADGYPRLLSNRGEVTLTIKTTTKTTMKTTTGVRCKVRGRVCMDQMLIEVPAEARVGDVVTIFGDENSFPNAPRAEFLADLYGGMAYEFLVSVGKRMQKYYID